MDNPAGTVWLLDVDGVINANRAGWGKAPSRARCAGLKIRWEPEMVARIRALHQSGAVEVRWATTWCGYREQLDALGRLLHLDLAPAFRDRHPSKVWAEMKAEAAVAVLAAGGRLVWTDDDEADVAPRFYPQLATAVAGGRALLIAPASSRGLRPEHLDMIGGFVGAGG